MDKNCHQQFSVKTQSVFEDSPVPLDKWLTAVWLIVNCKNGVSSWELHRDLGVTQKTAWFMLHRIRLALKDGNWGKLGNDGPVEVDEAFIGGEPKNWHIKKRKARMHHIGKTDKPWSSKIPVVGMIDRDTRKARAQVVPEVSRGILQNAILENISPGGTVYTDRHTGYCDLKTAEFVHETVNHLREYVRGDVHTNSIENFWSLLKRGLKGTYVAVEPFHLDRYLDEQVFRYNNRATKDNPLNDADRFCLAVSQIAGKRLTYAELTGKTERPEAF
jgi:ISXO2-like transposase domain